MGGAIHVLLPASAAHLVPVVREAGAIPVVDATGATPPAVPEGAWVRIRPGRSAPGTGPVILAEFGSPVTDRPTWLETAEPREIPPGFAGLVLKGREAGGACGEADGLDLLALCPDPSRVILDAGVGPVVAGATAALGAAGVLLVEQHLGCPEIGLPAGLAKRLDVADAEISHTIGGLRVSASVTARVLREIAAGKDPWALADELWTTGDPRTNLWIAGQGLALARGLAERHGTLRNLLLAYKERWERWPERARAARIVESARAVGTAAGLREPGTCAGRGGVVGSAVLWEEAAWMDRPISGRLEAALATGLAVSADRAEAEAVRERMLARYPAPEAASPPVGPSGPTVIGDSAVVDHSGAPARIALGDGMGNPSREGGAIAIVGMGLRFPNGASISEFWANVTNGVSAIGEVPAERWDRSLYFDSDPNAPDKSYTVIGGFLRNFQFNPKRFRIPPKVAKQIDPVQQITLECVADALEDANLQVDAKSSGRPFDRARCAVILGNSLGGEIKDDYALRIAWPEIERKLRAELTDLTADRLESVVDHLKTKWNEGLPEVDEDSMPGELSNVIAGRIANAFDLAGANFTVDAACASSMAAMQAAVKGLQDHDFDIVLTGGADRSMNISTYVKFCKIGALSPDHSAPFDASANGFVMGEGCGILVLKRYEDALRDGDRVYSVIRGIGASSDGKGKGITAPNKQGQLRALERAYGSAGVDPATVDLIECHGTSTVVGDQIEVEAVTDFVGPGKRAGRGPIRIGSVKSMIGHLKSAAGAASVVKVSLALYHAVLPPSIGFKNARPDVNFDVVPLQVQTKAEPWPATPDGVRRAGVSAFGFGGTNFHMVLESAAGQAVPRSTAQAPTTVPYVVPAPVYVPEPLAAAALAAAPALPVDETVERSWPAGVWCASARDNTSLVHGLREIAEGRLAHWSPSDPLRIAAAADSVEELKGQLDRAIKVVEKGANPDMLRARAIYYEDAPTDGKLAMLFTGQGSQYLDMGLDLAAEFPVVQETFDYADRVLTPVLGKPITDFIKLFPGEDAAAKEELLRQTEYSQPATLTIDVAILRLLASYGVLPDMVAGHSLGEYAACVAAGIMTFEQALYAVSARGREMANIELDDPGKMAGIAASTEAVEEVLAEVQGYVIAANKNCPSQTVIAGASDAVDEAAERFKARGITVYPLPVSHAFHSSIVSPASEPLRKMLRKIGLKPPIRPITTNVTAEYYPTGEGAEDAIIDLLARQIGAPVEWTAQIERMYADGARVFLEVGPKRALTGFVVSILKRRPHRALYTNHPKRGGVWSLRDALAGLLVTGQPVRTEPTAGIPDLLATPEPKRATTEAVTAHLALEEALEATPDVTAGILAIVAKQTGYDPAELDLGFELEADLGIDTVKQAEVFSVVRETYGIPSDPNFSFADHRTLQSVIDWAATQIGATRTSRPAEPPPAAPIAAPVASGPAIADDKVIAAFLQSAAKAGMDGMDGESFARALLPAVQGLLAAAFTAAQAAAKPVPVPLPVPVPVVPAPAPTPVPAKTLAIQRVVCSGTSIGLPGGTEVFAPENFADMLSGVNRITHVGDQAKQFLDIGLVRLLKDAQTGEGSFLPVTEESQVIRLAGTRASFDATAYGLPESLVKALDICSQMAIAAGLEALRDAGIPLVRTFKDTVSGKKVPTGWALPESLRDETGVIFASAFPGYDQLIQKLKNNADDGEGHFDRRFLFQVLAMGHSQFAQLIGARGPNTQVNAACASTTQATVMANDWIVMGRCKRVLVIGADDVTGPNLFKWIGGGFLASGAATTKDKVEEAALPFDRRRHGMILGMGAVGFVIEADATCRERGVLPISELVGTAMANSAFHGTRLDTTHIAGVFKGLIDDVCAREGVTPAQIASSAMFMSHETYTPARGGSAAAEIEALRAAFGKDASKISVANTKGFTGHPMGAGIEDAIAVKALQYGIVPPVANFQEPDEALGDLRISLGERRDLGWAVRLSAGFGSQLALTVWKRVARGDARVPDMAARAAWLRRVTGYEHVAEEVSQRTLRAVEATEDRLLAVLPDVSPADSVRLPGEGNRPAMAVRAPVAVVVPAVVATVAAAAPAAPSRKGVGAAQVQEDLLALVAHKTGYASSELEPDFELEADLGIDTVKQAEIFSELREKYGLQRDDDFKLADYPTIAKLATYLAAQTGSAPAQTGNAPAQTSAPAPAQAAPAAPAAREPVASAVVAAPPAAAPAPAATKSRRKAPITVVAAASAPADSSQMLAELLVLVAAKTGYEPSDLEPEFELEADLGIDTVKQAEIFSEIRDRHGLQRDDGFKLADFPTIAKLAGYLASRASGTNPPPPDEEDPDAEAPTQTFRRSDPVQAPKNLAKPLPAGPAQAAEPARAAEPAAKAPEPAKEARAATPAERDQMLAELTALVAEKTGYEPHDVEPDFELEADLGIDTVKQAEIFSQIRDRHGLARDDAFRLADHPSIRALSGYLADRVASGALHTGPVVPEPVRAESAKVDTFAEEEFETRITSDLDDGGSVTLPPSFRVRRPMLVDRPLGPVAGLDGKRVLVLGTDRRAEALRKELAARNVLAEGPYDAVVDASDDVMTPFHAAQQLDASRPRSWVTLTRLGDLDGIYPIDRAAADGARAGFAKAIGREWPAMATRVVGLQGLANDDETARAACDEIAASLVSGVRGVLEVFRARSDRRTIAYRTEALPRAGTLLDAPVVLVTGGGRGVSARIALELAQRGPVRLALIGRGPIATEALDVAAEKERIKSSLKATKAKVTPVEVDRRLDPLRRADEVRANVAQMEEVGAEVKYFRCDIGDEAAVAAMLEEIESSMGPVDVVIHGAGVEESRLIADKDDTAFHRVFDGKAKGGLALLKALGPEVYFISMGSVAGRFGNAGQVDYSAANEAMARTCLTRPRSLHIDWTAWDDVGMAVRGGMKTLLSDRGIDLLPADAGAGLAVDLIAAGVTGELVVAGRLGDFSPSADHPLLDRIEMEGDIVRGYRELSVPTAPWILDHAIDGVPVLPGVIGLEMMAAAAVAASPGLAYVGARNVKFEAPVKIHKDQPVMLIVEARPSSDGREVRCALSSERKLRTGRSQKTEHFSAVVLLGEARDLEGLPSAFFPDEELAAPAIYERFFHGPAFQVLRSIQGVASDGLIGEAAVDSTAIAEFLLTEPLILEAAFQAAGLHRMLVAAEMALPSAIDHVRLLRACPHGEVVTLMVHIEGDRYHVDVDGTDGPILRLRGFAMIDRGPLPPPKRFVIPEGGRPDALPATSRSKGARANGAIARAEADEDPTPWLAPDEIAALSARGTDRRVRDRMAGRIAAKKALFNLTGAPPLRTRVESAESGEPVAVVPGHPGVRVSITHREGHAVAIAVRTGRIGVDLERVQARPAGFAEDWYTAGERASLGEDPARLTVAWAVKEAVQKALGAGMAVHPRDIEVQVGEGRAEVVLTGEASATLARLGGGTLGVRWWREGDEVVAEARIAA